MREYPFYHYVIAQIQISRYHLHILEHVNLPARHFYMYRQDNHSHSSQLQILKELHQLKNIEYLKTKQEMISDSFAYLNLKSFPPL